MLDYFVENEYNLTCEDAYNTYVKEIEDAFNEETEK